MSIKIEKKIVSYSVVDKTDEQKDEKKEIPAEVVQIGCNRTCFIYNY
jgi:hypothetical protein